MKLPQRQWICYPKDPGLAYVMACRPDKDEVSKSFEVVKKEYADKLLNVLEVALLFESNPSLVRRFKRAIKEYKENIE